MSFFRHIPCLCLLLPFRAAPLLAADTPSPPPFSRYEIILARMPFGLPAPVAVSPAAVDPAVQQQSLAEQQLAKQIAMVAVNITPAGKTAVGFIDKAEKPPRNYYLGVGESANGFVVEEASYEEETATLSKDGVAITIKLGVGVISTPAAAAAAVPAPRPFGSRLPAPLPVAKPAGPPATPRGRRAPGLFPALTPQSMPLPGTLKGVDRALSIVKDSSYVARLKQRREELLAASQAQDQAQQSRISEAADERAAQLFTMLLRRRNMDMIRRGEGSLGIELTPEEDAQLVKEGVLPAGN
jgi:hypothetical protein